MEGKSILTELISFFGVSGREHPVRNFILKQIKPYVDEVQVDRMGNLIARKKGKPPKVMLAAHMDEIGLLVKRIDDKGFVYTTPVGGVDPAAFIGSAVHIQTSKQRIHGFLTTHELSEGKYIEKVPTMEDLYIDTGMTRDELKRKGVQIGNPVQLDTHVCCEDKGDLVYGKSLDNRIGCYMLIELAKKLKKSPGDIYYVFTVQEEVGLYGAKTSSFTIEPDWGIVVDTTWANDVWHEPSRRIGKGPCLVVKDGEFISNDCIMGWLTDIAKKKRIPIQLEATDEGTTDAAIIQTSKGGVPTAAVTIPVRNIHTTAGIAKMSDVKQGITLLHELLKRPPKHCIV